MRRKLEKVFDDQIRPALAAHGGGAEIVDIDDNKIYLRLSGGCQGCSASSATLKDGIERLIKGQFPHIKEVVDLTDHDSGTNPYFSSRETSGETPL